MEWNSHSIPNYTKHDYGMVISFYSIPTLISILISFHSTKRNVKVSNLMVDGRKLWSINLVQSLFTLDISAQILRLQIPNSNKDRLIYAFNCSG